MSLDWNLKKSDPEALCDALDASGIIPAPGETVSAFLERAEAESNAPPFDVSGEPDFTDAVPIPPEVLAEGSERTERLFGFAVPHVPGYFVKHGMGLLWGGFTLEDEHGRVCFALRDPFRTRRRWFLYDRAELLAHEQCHAARTPLGDTVYEEMLAYMTSEKNFLRRYLGGCFRSRAGSAAVCVFLTVLFVAELAAAFRILPFTLPLWPFMMVFLLFLFGVLIRNHIVRRRYFRAGKNLSAVTDRPDAMLFRAVADEIGRIADTAPEEIPALLERFAQNELRWAVALRRFRK